MPECPSCSDSFPTERGMKTHHARVHGESLAKETFICRSCGEEDEYYPSWENGIYCSEKCMGRDMAGDKNPAKRPEVALKISESLSGQERPWLKGDRNPQSDPEVRLKNSEWHQGRCLSEETRKKISCSLKDFYSRHPHPFENFSGENHPQWKGGYKDYYGPSWTDELRELVRERDDRTCQECGISESDLTQRLDVHHIIPFRKFGLDRHGEANETSNLISLCHPCHMQVEGQSVSVEELSSPQP